MAILLPLLLQDPVETQQPDRENDHRGGKKTADKP